MRMHVTIMGIIRRSSISPAKQVALASKEMLLIAKITAGFLRQYAQHARSPAMGAKTIA